MAFRAGLSSEGLRPGAGFYDARCRAGFVLKALGSARQPFFLLLAEKKEGKEKGTPRLGLRYAPTALRFSPFPARVDSLPALGQTCTRLIPEKAAMLGCTKGEEVLRSRLRPPRPVNAAVGRAAPGDVRRTEPVLPGWQPVPVDAAEHRRQKTDQREDCPSDRRSRVPQRPFCAEKRREPLASGEGQVVGGLFFWVLFFGRAKKSTAGARCRALSRTHPRASVHETVSGCIGVQTVLFPRTLFIR